MNWKCGLIARISSAVDVVVTIQRLDLDEKQSVSYQGTRANSKARPQFKGIDGGLT